MNINLLKYNKIDINRYDQAIANSFNANIFALSWFLNISSPHWELLATDDYSFCMPLPIKKSFGITLFGNGLYCKQLGIFSKENVFPDTLEQFRSALPRTYFPSDYALNIFNPGNQIKKKPVFSLDLIMDYERMTKRYSEKVQKLLHSEEVKNKYHFSESLSNHAFLQFYEACSRKLIRKSILNQKINLLRMIISTGMRYRFLSLYGIYNERNSLVEAAILLKSFGRIILLEHANRQNHAAFVFLIDSIIRQFSGNAFILDYYPEEEPEQTNLLFSAFNSSVNYFSLL